MVGDPYFLYKLTIIYVAASRVMRNILYESHTDCLLICTLLSSVLFTATVRTSEGVKYIISSWRWKVLNRVGRGGGGGGEYNRKKKIPLADRCFENFYFNTPNLPRSGTALSRLSQSIHFGDVSETNGTRVPKRIDRANYTGLGARQKSASTPGAAIFCILSAENAGLDG